MKDYLVRALAQDGAIRCVAAVTTGMVAEAQERHHALPTAADALGRALTGVALLGSSLKYDDTLAIRIDGGGPLGGLLVEANGRGHLRGYVKNPLVDLEAGAEGRFGVAEAVGKDGFVHVISDLGLKEPYTGMAPIRTGEIAEDLANYLLTSEQIPSAVALGVLIGKGGGVRASGGYMIQTLGGIPEDERERIERNLRAIGGVSLEIDAGTTPEELLERALKGFEHQVLEPRPLEFRCRCSRERALYTMAGVSPQELDDMIRVDGGAELICHFCNQRYHFEAGELIALRHELETRRSQEPED
ncbi:MAG: Hsp33 family molecular chaperone HslO [Candidatus Xenobium sp.]|jgi:molecular chaperone Hsp33|nr:Hsp33 family molecular chaperone HslO [Burkholderiales bacterium]